MKPSIYRGPFVLYLCIVAMTVFATATVKRRPPCVQALYRMAGDFPAAPRSITVTNRTPPIPDGAPATLTRTSVALPAVALSPTVTTNADGSVTTCFPAGYFNAKLGRTVTNAYCVTNFPKSPEGLYLSWTQSNFIYGVSWWTNVLLYSTNGPSGPWNNRVLIPCTNVNMTVRIIINARLPCFFPRLGTNLF